MSLKNLAGFTMNSSLTSEPGGRSGPPPIVAKEPLLAWATCLFFNFPQLRWRWVGIGPKLSGLWCLEGLILWFLQKRPLVYPWARVSPQVVWKQFSLQTLQHSPYTFWRFALFFNCVSNCLSLFVCLSVHEYRFCEGQKRTRILRSLSHTRLWAVSVCAPWELSMGRHSSRTVWAFDC